MCEIAANQHKLPNVGAIYEKEYVQLAQKLLGGQMEYVLPGSNDKARADLVTDTHHYEFKTRDKPSTIAKGIEQLRRYGQFLPSKRLCLFLCGDHKEVKIEAARKQVLREKDIEFRYMSKAEAEQKLRDIYDYHPRPYLRVNAASKVLETFG
jgi:hypothetical protein